MFDCGPSEYFLARAVADRVGRYGSSKYVSRILAPDASLSRGCSDVPLWSAPRVRLWARGERWPADAEQPEYFTLAGAAYRAGLSYQAAKRAMAKYCDAFLIYGEERHPLFTQDKIEYVRKLVAAGKIRIRYDGLKHPKRGVYISAPIHRHAPISGENAWRRRNRPMVY
jgi:hypothetical protein